MNRVEKINELFNGRYGYYFDDKYAIGGLPGGGKSLLDCEDDRITQIRKTRNKIRELSEPVEITRDIMSIVSPIIHEMHEILKTDLMENGLNETEANLLIDRMIVFNHWEFKEIDGKQHVSIKPMLRDEYEKQVREHFQK